VDCVAGDKLLDFKKKTELKICQQAIFPLTTKRFDCCEENLNDDFLTAFQYRANEHRWDESIMQIHITDPNDPDPKEADLLTEYAKASIKRIRAYEFNLVTDKTRRARQDMTMLYQCLTSSSRDTP
jgi:hypothetical protein